MQNGDFIYLRTDYLARKCVIFTLDLDPRELFFTLNPLDVANPLLLYMHDHPEYVEF